eukprot:TRINITY_DN6330_c0_g1_i1.p1 TRINITY_DN6330_c0_g1~~TRINITY_DN6330_c0_g1_i1.p1  ORF type:complete len:109 (+),score=0.11 TRINITY_DN6330_c0_g1_i1:129-455(+)
MSATSTFLTLRVSPALTLYRTIPDFLAGIAVCIFIASITIITSPFSTASPSENFRTFTDPGIGDVIWVSEGLATTFSAGPPPPAPALANAASFTTYETGFPLERQCQP